MNDIATINRIYEWAKKNQQKYYDKYQIDGAPSSFRTAERYDDICDICNAAAKGVAEEDVTRHHIHRNQSYMIDQLHDLQKVSPGKTFNYDEVEQWMRKMMV